jgi:hypothetical protein
MGTWGEVWPLLLRCYILPSAFSSRWNADKQQYAGSVIHVYSIGCFTTDYDYWIIASAFLDALTKTVTSTCWLHHVYLSVCPHEKIRLSMFGFSWPFITGILIKSADKLQFWLKSHKNSKFYMNTPLLFFFSGHLAVSYFTEENTMWLPREQSHCHSIH